MVRIITLTIPILCLLHSVFPVSVFVLFSLRNNANHDDVLARSAALSVI